MDKPPLLPRPKSLRFAFTLNLMLPGAGQLYLGQVRLGAAYLVGFLACFMTMLLIFFRFYQHYIQLATDGSLLDGGRLEQLTDSIPTKLLLTVLILASGICIASLVSLGRAGRGNQETPVG
jgi:hypothetical protein